MIGEASIVLVALVLVLFASWLVRRFRASSDDKRESRERHEAAREREPPVEIGDVRTVAIEEFTTHHSGDRRAVCKVEGFVVFVEDLPDGLAETDVIEAKILSFNRGHTSATARFLERA